MFTLLIYGTYRVLPCLSQPRIREANPAGRQTDATVVNIFWPWDQLLRLVGGPDKPHRMVQTVLSTSAKPEEDLRYRWTKRWTEKKKKNPTTWRLILISSLRREKHSFLLPGLRWRARLSSEAKTTKEEQKRPNLLEEVEEQERRCLFSVKEVCYHDSRS